MQFLKDISDLAKFFIMLLLYTGYMTWWAATVSHNIQENRDHIDQHIAVDRVINEQTITLASSVHHIQQEIKDLKNSERETTKLHAKCAAVMEQMLKRLEKLEK